MLGSDLGPLLAVAGYEVFARPKSDLDITDEKAVARALREARPEVVINCAAFTKVDACETDPRAFEVNAKGVGYLADACGHVAAQLVQVSTDFVFDGEKRAPYAEDDPPRPLSAYGRSKLGGEEEALRLPGSMVVRASWLFGRSGWNFVEAILKQAESGAPRLSVVTDQVGRPTATTDLSEAIVALLDAGPRAFFTSPTAARCPGTSSPGRSCGSPGARRFPSSPRPPSPWPGRLAGRPTRCSTRANTSG